MISTETTQQLFEGAAVAHWNVCACVICGARAGYVFKAGQPPTWSGGHERCSEPLPPRPSSWQDSPTASMLCPKTCWRGCSWLLKAWRGRSLAPCLLYDC
jgi:hypothetical protein